MRRPSLELKNAPVVLNGDDLTGGPARPGVVWLVANVQLVILGGVEGVLMHRAPLLRTNLAEMVDGPDRLRILDEFLVGHGAAGVVGPPP
jgi:hypothetical protein